MLSVDEGKKAVQFARDVVENHVKTGTTLPSVVGEMFEKKTRCIFDNTHISKS